jgi:hypothetical protein
MSDRPLNQDLVSKSANYLARIKGERVYLRVREYLHKFMIKGLRLIFRGFINKTPHSQI